jgi:hypothetical protein
LTLESTGGLFFTLICWLNFSSFQSMLQVNNYLIEEVNVQDHVHKHLPAIGVKCTSSDSNSCDILMEQSIFPTLPKPINLVPLLIFLHYGSCPSKNHQCSGLRVR